MVIEAANEALDKIITWMTDDVRAPFKYMRETNEVFKIRYERNRKNKAKGSTARIGRN